MILPYQKIKLLCQINSLVSPWNEKTNKYGLSFGLSESGYDIRIAQDVVLYPITLKNLVLNALGFKRPSFSLASSIEHFSIPDYLMPSVMDKSTWAREGLTVQTTVLEPGWRGYLTLELCVHGPKKLVIKAGTPIAQIVFHVLTEPTEMPYIGKYNNQKNSPQDAILFNTIKRD